MAQRPTLSITIGEVLDVQFTSETHVSGSRGAVASRIINKQRIFYRDVDRNEERDVTFANCTVGVREGHRIALVRGARRRRDQPVMVALINLSTGQREEMSRNLEAVAIPKPMFGPPWVAMGFSTIALLLFMVVWKLASKSQGWVGPFFNALMLAFLLYPVFWGGVLIYDRFTHGARRHADLSGLRAEIERLLRPYVQGGAGSKVIEPGAQSAALPPPKH